MRRRIVRLGVVEPDLGLEHHYLVVTLVVRVLCVIRGPAFWCNLARLVWDVMMVLALHLIQVMGLMNPDFTRRLVLCWWWITLRKAACYRAGAKVTSVRKIVETHVCIVWLVSPTTRANLKRWTANFVIAGWDQVRTHTQRCVFLVCRVATLISKVLLCRMRSSNNYRVFVEHLTIWLILCELSIVIDLVFDLWCDLI